MERPDWQRLLHQALSKPGTLSKAYSAFHVYSIGNQILVAMELYERGLPLSPIATYKQWEAMGRHVRKGEKALSMIMPVTVRVPKRDPDPTEDEEGAEETRTIFLLKRNWFSLDQTEGEPYVSPPIPGWDRDKALSTLGIMEVPFESLNGNIQGYARRGVPEIAINPIAQLPWKTLFHEVAHHLLGHTAAGGDAGGDLMVDGLHLPQAIQEAEAEGVAYLCCATLGLPGAGFSRAYIQGWLQGESLPDRSVRRIFAAADKILKAGEVAGQKD